MVYRSRPLTVALFSSVLVSGFIFACSSDDPADDPGGVGGTNSTSAGASSKGGGTAKGGTTGVGNGGTTTGKGGSAPSNGGATVGNGGSSPSVGGSGVGGAVGPVAGNAGRGSTGPQGSCVAGVDTGDDCNPTVDTTACVRSTRTCNCSAQTQEWVCTPNGAGGTGNTGSGGRSNNNAGAPPNIAGNAGLAGFAGAGSPLAASCRRNGECDTEGQWCDKSQSRTDPRTCTCTNGNWACVDA